MQTKFEKQIALSADEYNFPQQIILAVIKTESNFDPFAFRYEEHYRWFFQVDEYARKNIVTKNSARVLQASSHGLMQIMGATACEMGLKGPIQQLYIPSVGIKYGCKYLAHLREKYYLRSSSDLYAAYNAGSVRYDLFGDYINKDAVDRFEKNLQLFS